MKWKAWVAEVDRQIKEKGLDADPDILWIDIHMPQNAEEVDVGVDADLYLVVSSL